MDAISQNSFELLFVKDRQCRLVYANDSLLRLLGKSADEIVGKTDIEFHSDPLLGEAVMENDRMVRETRQSLIAEEGSVAKNSKKYVNL
jgi:PAS domain S-box-containing protein